MLAAMFFSLSCTKKDIQVYKHYLKKNPCRAVSFNAGKQSTSDFYMVKTFDANGVLTHLKTQLKDIEGNTYVYDYDITYTSNVAKFEGSTTVYRWDFDKPEEHRPWDEKYDPPVHPVELTDQKDTRGFSITLDEKTGYATKAQFNDGLLAGLHLRYDKRGFLDSVIVNYHFVSPDGDHFSSLNYDATTDESGNIMSVYLKEEPTEQVLGLRYDYNEVSSKGHNQFYEPTNIFIHPLFTLLEVLNWGPFQPDHERTLVEIITTFRFPGIDWDYLITSDYVNHQYDERGNLTGYTFSGEFTKGFGYWGWAFRGVRDQRIEWTCNGSKVK